MIKPSFILLAIEWSQIIGTATATSLLAVILFLLKWKRFKPNDVAQVNMSNAQTEKIKAEAAEIKAKADTTIVESSLKLIQRLSDECDMTKKKLEKTQSDLDSAIDALRIATNKLSEVQNELNSEREKNKEMSLRILTLTEELNKLKTNSNGIR